MNCFALTMQGHGVKSFFCKRVKRFDQKSINYSLPEIDQVIFCMPSSLPAKQYYSFSLFPIT